MESMRFAIPVIGGVFAGALMWPTEDCVSTLMLPPGRNTPSCTSVIGLPTHEIAAVALGLVVAFVLWRLLGSRSGGDG